MTRTEAIEMAVRRVARLHTRPVIALCNAYNNVPAPLLTSIRAHFCVICRQYGVEA